METTENKQLSRTPSVTTGLMITPVDGEDLVDSSTHTLGSPITQSPMPHFQKKNPKSNRLLDRLRIQLASFKSEIFIRKSYQPNSPGQTDIDPTLCSQNREEETDQTSPPGGNQLYVVTQNKQLGIEEELAYLRKKTQDQGEQIRNLTQANQELRKNSQMMPEVSEDPWSQSISAEAIQNAQTKIKQQSDQLEDFNNWSQYEDTFRDFAFQLGHLPEPNRRLPGQLVEQIMVIYEEESIDEADNQSVCKNIGSQKQHSDQALTRSIRGRVDCLQQAVVGMQQQISLIKWLPEQGVTPQTVKQAQRLNDVRVMMNGLRVLVQQPLYNLQGQKDVQQSEQQAIPRDLTLLQFNKSTVGVTSRQKDLLETNLELTHRVETLKKLNQELSNTRLWCRQKAGVSQMNSQVNRLQQWLSRRQSRLQDLKSEIFSIVGQQKTRKLIPKGNCKEVGSIDRSNGYAVRASGMSSKGSYKTTRQLQGEIWKPSSQVKDNKKMILDTTNLRAQNEELKTELIRTNQQMWQVKNDRAVAKLRCDTMKSQREQQRKTQRANRKTQELRLQSQISKMNNELIAQKESTKDLSLRIKALESQIREKDEIILQASQKKLGDCSQDTVRRLRVKSILAQIQGDRNQACHEQVYIGTVKKLPHKKWSKDGSDPDSSQNRGSLMQNI